MGSSPSKDSDTNNINTAANELDRYGSMRFSKKIDKYDWQIVELNEKIKTEADPLKKTNHYLELAEIYFYDKKNITQAELHHQMGFKVLRDYKKPLNISQVDVSQINKLFTYLYLLEGDILSTQEKMDFEEADRCYNTAFSYNVDTYEVHYRLGIAAYRKSLIFSNENEKENSMKMAIQQLSKAIEFVPTDADMTIKTNYENVLKNFKADIAAGKLFAIFNFLATKSAKGSMVSAFESKTFKGKQDNFQELLYTLAMKIRSGSNDFETIFNSHLETTKQKFSECRYLNYLQSLSKIPSDDLAAGLKKLVLELQKISVSDKNNKNEFQKKVASYLLNNSNNALLSFYNFVTKLLSEQKPHVATNDK